MTTKREFLKRSALAGAGSVLLAKFGFIRRAFAAISGGTLNPASITKYTMPLVIPPAMPRTSGGQVDYYEIAVRQFQQQILPAPMPTTTVWSYGSVNHPSTFNYPAFTIEARYKRPVRVKWINDLKDANGNFLPHLLPVDPTLHWANPLGGTSGRDMRPDFTGKTYVPLANFTDPNTQYTQYTGPVPMVTHVHGAVGVGDESDGYAEAWYLASARNIPSDFATEGTWYNFFSDKAAATYGVVWGPGFATFQYPNRNRASTIWYHDHALGMTRLNVYAGPAGFYLIRGGPAGDDVVVDSRSNTPAVLPGPAPKEHDK